MSPARVSAADLVHVLQGAIDGALAPFADPGGPLYWVNWLALGLVQHRARQLCVARRLGRARLRADGGVVPGLGWAYEQSPGMRDVMTIHANGDRVAFRVQPMPDPYGDGGDGGLVSIDPEWMLALDFCGRVERGTDDSMTFARLNVVMPGLASARLGTWLVSELGGMTESEPAWLRLPYDLERLATSLGDFDITSIDDLPRWGEWFGDPVLIEPLDREWLQRIAQRHRDFIFERVAAGQPELIDAMPIVLRGRDLVHACDALLERHAHNPLVYAPTIELLRRSDAPPSEVLTHLAIHLGRHSDTIFFQCAVPYLLEHGIAVGHVLAHLWNLARSSSHSVAFDDDTVVPQILPAVLLHDSELGLALVRRALAQASRAAVQQTAALLAALAAPWCVATLNEVPSSAPHHDVAILALAALGVVASFRRRSALASCCVPLFDDVAGEHLLDRAIDDWRCELGRLPASHLRSLQSRRELLPE